MSNYPHFTAGIYKSQRSFNINCVSEFDVVLTVHHH